MDKLHEHSHNRNLSANIISRWYRPPEVILMEKYYDSSVDIWSLGCCIAELIHCS
jgi:serine/threonine protein kinase